MLHAISWSGGKDSTATILLFKQHWNELMMPGDKAVILFAEVMFDRKKGISGHNPDIINFIHTKAKIFEEWGFEVHILHAEKDYLDFFHHIMGKSRKIPEHEGMMYGFPASGLCGIKRDCKLKPMEEWKKLHKDEGIIEYVGIAADEQKRLNSLYSKPNTVSLLATYGYAEEDAMALCKEYDMVSPQYDMIREGENKSSKKFFFPKTMKRDGCWFCPNAKLCEHKAIYEKYPDAWATYVALENETVAYPKWNCFSKETLHDRDLKIKELIAKKDIEVSDIEEFKQLSIFDYLAS